LRGLDAACRLSDSIARLVSALLVRLLLIGCVTIRYMQ
jgi:hypothetical protein